MHSSGMRTACLLTVSHSICRGCLPLVLVGGICYTPRVDTPLGRHPFDKHPPGQTTASVHAGIHTHCPVHAGIHTSPMDRQTPVKTLPSQTSFAGSNNDCFTNITKTITQQNKGRTLNSFPIIPNISD